MSQRQVVHITNTRTSPKGRTRMRLYRLRSGAGGRYGGTGRVLKEILVPAGGQEAGALIYLYGFCTEANLVIANIFGVK